MLYLCFRFEFWQYLWSYECEVYVILEIRYHIDGMTIMRYIKYVTEGLGVKNTATAANRP